MTLGLARGEVRVVPYDPAWPAAFAAERERLRKALGGLAMEVEHVGSTSVPGLAAKPVLDLAAGRPPESALEPYVRALEGAGYTYRGENGIAGRHLFVRGSESARTHHLHLVALGGEEWERQRAFRDALRADPAARDAYAALKHDLAARHPGDRAAYTGGKADFIARVLREAAAKGESR